MMASLLWGAGGWLLSVACLNRLETFEPSLLRRVTQVPRLVSGNWVEYLRRIARVARDFLQKSGIDSLAVRVLTRIHGWSGHLVRLPVTSPQARALKFRNEERWAHTQELGNPPRSVLSLGAPADSSPSKLGSESVGQDDLAADSLHFS